MYELTPKEVFYIVHERHRQKLDYVFLTRAYKKCKEWFSKEFVKEGLQTKADVKSYIERFISREMGDEGVELLVGRNTKFLTDMVIKFLYEKEMKDV